MSTLKKINEAEVVSSNGFSVKYGRHSLTYLEGDRYVNIPIEHLGQPYELIVYLDLIDTWMVKGKPSDKISAMELNLIQKRIHECLDFLPGNFSIRR